MLAPGTQPPQLARGGPGCPAERVSEGRAPGTPRCPPITPSHPSGAAPMGGGSGTRRNQGHGLPPGTDPGGQCPGCQCPGGQCLGWWERHSLGGAGRPQTVPCQGALKAAGGLWEAGREEEQRSECPGTLCAGRGPRGSGPWGCGFHWFPQTVLRSPSSTRCTARRPACPPAHGAACGRRGHSLSRSRRPFARRCLRSPAFICPAQAAASAAETTLRPRGPSGSRCSASCTDARLPITACPRLTSLQTARPSLAAGGAGCPGRGTEQMRNRRDVG